MIEYNGKFQYSKFTIISTILINYLKYSKIFHNGYNPNPKFKIKNNFQKIIFKNNFQKIIFKIQNQYFQNSFYSKLLKIIKINQINT